MQAFTSVGGGTTENMSNDPRMCVFEFASTCLCVCMLFPMCPWGTNVFADMHLLMCAHTHTHTQEGGFLSVFACTQSAEVGVKLVPRLL